MKDILSRVGYNHKPYTRRNGFFSGFMVKSLQVHLPWNPKPLHRNNQKYTDTVHLQYSLNNKNRDLVKWAIPFLCTSRYRWKSIWKIITTILAIFFPKSFIRPLNHSLKLIMVVRIKSMNITKVHIWATWLPKNNTGCLPVCKLYFDIISTYSQVDYYIACCIDQWISCNIKSVDNIFLILIRWIERYDCLS